MSALRRAIPFAIFCGIVLLLEVLLGLLRLDRYDDRFTPRSSFPLFVPGDGEFSDFFVTNGHFRRSLNFQRFRRVKGPGVVRVFVLGGSAAYGWPVRENEAFTGYLRRALDAVAPGRFEIVNAAGVSYGSHRMRDLLNDVLRFEPDLVVIYEGNNEYVERNVLPSAEREGGFAIALRNRLSRSNIYRALRLAIWKTPALGALLERSRTRAADITDPRFTPAVARGILVPTDAIRGEVLANFRGNLSEMSRMLDRSGVRSVFCSVPVNLCDWLPAGIAPRFGDRDLATRWTGMAKEGVALAERDPKRAAPLLREVVRLQPDWAPGAFLLGRALEASGDYAQALEMYRIARDRDARPLRAVGAFNEAVRAVASSGRLTSFLDLEAIFRERSPHGVTGTLLMRDYCHPTEAGHKLIATLLLPVVLEGQDRGGVRAGAEALILADPTARTKDPATTADELYARGMALNLNNRWAEAEKAFLEVIRLNPDQLGALGDLGYLCLRDGRLAEGERYLRRALTVDPDYVFANFNLAWLQFVKGDMAAAEDGARRVLRLNPAHPEATMLQGEIALRRGDDRAALEYFRKTIALGREDSALHLLMGKASLALGDNAAASRELGKALQFDPDNEEAARLLRATGRSTEGG